MKRYHYLRFIAVITGFICCITINYCFAQNKAEMTVTFPFDSLTVDSIETTGSLKTGTLEIRMTFHNNYSATAGVSLSLGAFEDFGITDEKEKKYKIFTDSHLIGTQDVNKGYLKIPFFKFGDKKYDWVTVIKQNLSHDQHKELIVRISHFNKENKTIKEFHIRCILALNLEYVGAKLCKVENIPVEWK